MSSETPAEPTGPLPDPPDVVADHPVLVPTPPPAAPPAPRDPNTPAWFPQGSGFNTVRDMVLFLVGLGILGQQIFLSEEVNSFIVSLGAAAVGLPVVLRTDSKTK